ncbi:tripartite tricarboxylate transporter TctB family protein [Paracoccus sp. MA]|uniref:tripartite tricarboxylate transporter TctB family protein n=1 Tax=Paracoccus sp. MA TaxID=2895796 RepID=UPI001E5E59D4|nr:tripartite tricarboxylate transporter TctB family protein [Paracoccus sp. MA]UFM66857.1 tripartite tricarboxylate transporter TctB family protein [Paracoccus sp. MA]
MIAEQDGAKNPRPDPQLVMRWDRTHLIGGAIQSLIGLGALYVASGYSFGSSVQMGPGYFPRILSVIFVVLGLITMATGRRAVLPSEIAAERQPLNWRPPLFIFGSILLFLLLIDRAGFVVTIFAVTVFARLADRNVSWKSTLVVAAVTTALNVLIFILGLGMPLKVWW